MQVTRYPPHEGESYLLHGVRVMWVQAVRLCYQNRLPSPGRSEKENANIIIISRPTFCVPLLAYYRGMPIRFRFHHAQPHNSEDDHLERRYSSSVINVHESGRDKPEPNSLQNGSLWSVSVIHNGAYLALFVVVCSFTNR